MLVFVEVRSRSRPLRQDLTALFPVSKRKRLLRAVAYYPGVEERPCRFDLIAVCFGNGEPDTLHIRNAFGEDPT